MVESQAGVMAFLKAQPGWFRVDFDDRDVPYNAGDLYDIEQFGAAVSSMPLRTHRVLGQAETPRRFGIRYHVGQAPSRPGQVEVFRAPSGLKVFREPDIEEPMWAIRTAGCPGADWFHVVERLPERVIVEADLACPGLVVIGDPFYPGWRAIRDGQRVPVQEVDGLRAIAAAAGPHRIEFRYHPGTVYWGFALSLIGLATCAVVLVTRPA
jgi:hypothetical protein